MFLLCPYCKHVDLKVKNNLDLPANRYFDEIALQAIKCGYCGFEGIAVYKESKRGPLGQEIFEHTGYRVPEKTVKEVKKAIKSSTVEDIDKYIKNVPEEDKFKIMFRKN